MAQYYLLYSSLQLRSLLLPNCKGSHSMRLYRPKNSYMYFHSSTFMLNVKGSGYSAKCETAIMRNGKMGNIL